MTDKYVITAEEVSAMKGAEFTHFLNPNAVRRGKSLGDLTGLTGFGFHIVEIEPGFESTEKHVHYHEDECVYILSGEAEATVGGDTFTVKAGDFIGFRAGGKDHVLKATGTETFRMICVGQRLDHDVADYTEKGKRIFRNKGVSWSLADKEGLVDPKAG